IAVAPIATMKTINGIASSNAPRIRRVMPYLQWIRNARELQLRHSTSRACVLASRRRCPRLEGRYEEADRRSDGACDSACRLHLGDRADRHRVLSSAATGP